MRLKFWQARTPAATELPAASAARVSSTPAPIPEATLKRTPPQADPQAYDLDLRGIGQALQRRKMWIIIPTVVVAALSFAIVNMITPRYKSEARILIDGRENVFLRANADRAIEERSALDPEAVTSQVQLVLSRDLARDVIKKNKLAERPEFDPVLQGLSPLRALLVMAGIVRDPFKLTPEERVLDAYYDRLQAYAVDKSRVIAVEFQSRDPDLAARVANSIAEGYLLMQQAAKQDQAKAAGQWLSGEIENLRKKVADAEARVEDFRSKASLFIGNNNTTLSNQQMGDINTQLSAARAQKSDAESKARLIRDMLKSGRPIEAADVTNSELIRRLNEQQVTLRAQLAEQSSTLLDGHPRIKELRAQIADLDRQIRAEAGKISRSLENDARIAGARADAMSANLEQLKKQATSTNGQDVQLRALEREAKAQRDLLESYLAKYREATTRENIDVGPANGRIISKAFVSNIPAFPKRLPIVVIATLATLLLSAGIIITGELLRMTAPASVELAAERRAPVFAAPAHAESVIAPAAAATVAATAAAGEAQPAPAAAVAPEPEAVAAPSEELVQLVGQLRAAGEGARKVTIMGSGEPVATSATALALARLLVRDASVILIDMSLTGSSLGDIAVDPDAPGLTDLVAGSASFGQIITRDRMSRVQLIGPGRGKPDMATFQSPRLTMAIDALTKVYDHIVLDVGTLDDVPEALVSSNAQAVLVADAALDSDTRSVIEGELLSAGFRGVSVVSGATPAGSRRDPRIAA